MENSLSATKIIAKIKEKYNSLIYFINHKKWILLAIFVVTIAVLLVISLLLQFYFSVNRAKPSSTPPVKVVEFTPLPNIIYNPSRYASDSGVLKIEEEVKNLDSDLVKLDLKEVRINPPILNFNVEFPN